jgi:hypothetical protein
MRSVDFGKPARHVFLLLGLLLFVFFVFVACKKDNASPPSKGKTTHSTSAGVASLKDKQAFVEKYVTFRRSYSSLEYKIDFEDDTSMAPGPSSTACDVRLYAHVPGGEMNDWITGLEPTQPQDLTWTREIPNAPASSSQAFTWYAAPPSSFGGSKVVGFSPGKGTAEIFYRLVCARN